MDPTRDIDSQAPTKQADDFNTMSSAGNPLKQIEEVAVIYPEDRLAIVQ